MSFDRTTHLTLAIVEPDDLFRLGLQRYLRQYTQWSVRLETADAATVVEQMVEQLAQADPETLPDLLIWGLTGPIDEPTIAVWRSLKQQFPYLRILLLAATADPSLAAAWWLGVTGAVPRSSPETVILEAIWQVASGDTVWDARLKAVALGQEIGAGAIVRSSSPMPTWMQIDVTLQAIEQKLRSPRTNWLDRLVLQGRRRELRASRWITQRLLPGVPDQPVLQPMAPPSDAPIGQIQPTAQVEGLALATLGDRFAAKLQLPLDNRTEIPLEIDILRADKRRELLYVVLRQFEAIVEEVRFSQLPIGDLPQRQRQILGDLWRAVLPEFFGKYYRIEVAGQVVAVVEALSQQQDRVETDILSRIPLVPELFGYLLWQQPLVVDNQTFSASSPVAIAQGSAILENLIIQVANATIAPLLNLFADVELVKQSFYDRQRLSTRAIERFRNDLSWRYRRNRYVGEPVAMFESQYELFVLTELGIGRQAVYAPRRSQLDALTGIPLVVTLLLEARDAVAPRLRTATAFVGSGLVYVLTEVIGRGLGLVGRGIIKGIGNAFQDRT
jgi:DNA-binding NarL/FixJ family response regulator